MCDRTKYMSEDEHNHLRAFTREHGTAVDWLLIDVATQTGLRVSELARITIDDFDFPRSLLRVKRSKKRDPNTPPDQLPITSTLSDHVQSYLANTTPFPRDSRSIWRGQRGPWSMRALMQAWHRCCRNAGIVWHNKVGPNGRRTYGCSIHAARHTLAVRMLRQSKNLRMVQKQLGHSSPVTTANMYADVTFEEQQATLADLFK